MTSIRLKRVPLLVWSLVLLLSFAPVPVGAQGPWAPQPPPGPTCDGITDSVKQALCLEELTSPATVERAGQSASVGAPVNFTAYGDGSVAVYFNDLRQFFGGNASGVFLWAGGAAYGPTVPAGLSPNAYTQVANTLTGNGSYSTPWKARTVLDVAGTGLRIVQIITYIQGQSTLNFRWEVTNTSGQTVGYSLFHAADLYTQNNDYGYGFYDPELNAIGGYTSDRSHYQYFRPMTAGARYFENFYRTVWERIGSSSARGTGFDNTYLPDTYLDNGAGLQWNRTITAGGTDVVLDSLNFSDESNLSSIAGQVKDQHGGILSDPVTLTANNMFTVTSSGGSFEFANLPPGEYTLAATLAGYTFQRRAVSVPPSRTGIDMTGFNDCLDATARTPVMLVTGWTGSESRATSHDPSGGGADENMSVLADALENSGAGYKEGCNLFYATGTSAHKHQAENARVIRNDMCDALATMIEHYGSRWSGDFDIIGHSYGGLRARAYLEDRSLYGADAPACSDVSTGQVIGKVRVRQLVTLGTPHGGEYPDLPLSLAILLVGAARLDVPAIEEMMPSNRDTQNLFSSQARGVPYRLVAGDTRSVTLPLLLGAIVSLFHSKIHSPVDSMDTPNDLAVHRAGSYALGLPRYQPSYPDLTYCNTQDVHGRSWLVPQLNQVHSYVDGTETFWNIILPYLRNESPSACTRSLDRAAAPGAAAPQTMQRALASLSAPQEGSSLPLQNIASGMLASREVVTGTFTLDEPLQNQVTLAWVEGSVTLRLWGPNGAELTDGDAVHVVDNDSGFGRAYSFLLDNAATGTYTYRISAGELETAVFYRLATVPAAPLAIVARTPGWVANRTPVLLTAEVRLNGDTPATVPGWTVSVIVTRPDGSQVPLTLLDDGAHGDTAAGDGIYGVTLADTDLGGGYHVDLTGSGPYNGITRTRSGLADFNVGSSAAALGTAYQDAPVPGTGSVPKYGAVVVQVPVIVSTPGQFGAAADLYAGDTMIGHAAATAELIVGEQTISLSFSGKDIAAHRRNGPYTVRNVMLTDSAVVGQLVQTADSVHQTFGYQWSDFASVYPVFLPAIMKR